MNEELKVRFTGDASDLEAASKKSVSSLDNVSKATTKVSQSLTQASNQIATVSSKVSQSASNMAAGAAKAGGEIAKTKTNFTGLSRILQDLPFGFTAISNNLTQVLPAAGAAGLAISALTSALVFAQVGFGAWTRGIGGIGQSAKQLRFSISDINDVIKEASKKVGEDIVQLEVFKQKLNDVNLPASERLKILKEYNSTADKTNQIDATQINNLQLINEKLDAQNTLILKRALSTAAMSKISEAANKTIENELKLQEELSKRGFVDLDDYTKKTKAAADERAKLFVQNPNAFKEQQNLDAVKKGLDGVVTPAIKASEAIKNDDAALKGLISTVSKGRGDLQKFIGSISGLLTVEGVTTQSVQDKGSTEKQKTEFLFSFLPFDPSGKLKPEQKSQVNDAIDKFSKEFTGILKGVDFTRQAATEDEKIQLALKFDAKLKAGKVEFDIKAFTDAVNKGLKPDDLIPPDTLQGLASTVVDQFIRGFQNESERIKDANIFGNLTLSFDQQVDILKTRILQAGHTIPKMFDGIDIFGNKKLFSFDDLFDRSKISEKDALEALTHPFDAVQEKAEKTAEVLNTILAPALNAMFDAFQKGESPIQAFFKAMGQAIQQVIQKLIIAAAEAAILSAITGGASAGGTSFMGAFKKILGFAKGGTVPGTGNGDTVPAMLTPGEFVVTKDKAPLAAMLFGSKAPRITAGIFGFATGGLVPARAVDSTNNAATGPVTVMVPYVAGLDISHDKFRLLMKRADNYGNKFGR